MRKFLPKLSSNPQGFTLVELMVVITILAILAVVGITIYSGTQKTARDARRKSDVDAIANSMEANYGKTTAGQYNALAPTMFSSGQTPEDPVNTAATNCSANKCQYCYRQGAVAQAAGVCAAGDSVIPAGGGQPSGAAANPYWIVCSNLETASGLGGTTYYCRQNQQ